MVAQKIFNLLAVSSSLTGSTKNNPISGNDETRRVRRAKMPLIVVQHWEESERGWGTRPDGVSLHASVDSAKKYVDKFWADEKARNPSGIVPDEYDRPCGEPIPLDVDQETFDKIKGDGRLWRHEWNELSKKLSNPLTGSK